MDLIKQYEKKTGTATMLSKVKPYKYIFSHGYVSHLETMVKKLRDENKRLVKELKPN